MANNTSTTTGLTSQLLVAANSSSPLNFQIPSINIKLDRTNFSLWRNTVLPALQAFELEAHILTDDSPPQYKPQEASVTTPPESNPEYITWRRCDRFVLLWLRSTLSERALATVVRATTARQAWTTIDRTFQAQSRARRMALKNQLQSLSKGSLSIMEYFEKKRAIADALDENLQPISNEDLTGYILNGLDTSYGPFITSFMMRPEETNVDDLLGLLLQEEERIEQENRRHQPPSDSLPPPTTSSVIAPSANAAYTNSRGASSSRYSRGRSSAPPSSGVSEASRGPDGTTRRRIQCQICNKMGHMAINCYNRNNHTDFPARPPPPRNNHRSSDRQAEHSAHYASPSSLTDPAWYFDTGATDHVSNDLNRLTISDEYRGDDKLSVGNGNQLLISHSGSTILPTKSMSVNLKNVLIVPDLTKNLLSVSKLNRDNNTYMIFYPDHCVVKNLQGNTILHGTVDHGLYRLHQPRLHQPPPSIHFGTRTSLLGWHRRLAHPHEHILRRLVSQFQLPVSSNKFPRVCDACQLGKSHRFHLPSSHVRSDNPFELIYSDVWGPAPVLSLNGNRYFVFFIDDATKFIWIYFLSHKSQVFNVFQQFRAMVQTQFGSSIKCLQTDWGGEFRNVSSFLSTHGIQHRVSCPYTQEQNGAAERRNRIIVEKGLTLLAQSSSPFILWEHAFHTATYLHNRTISSTLNYTSPYQKLYSKIPDYDFVRTFGCLCYPFLRPYNNHKMDFRSLPCVFIGFSSKHKGYLCLHIPTSRTYIARHVVFDEDVYPYANQARMISPPPPSFESSPAPTDLLELAVAAPSPSTPLNNNSDPSPATTLGSPVSPNPTTTLLPTSPTPPPPPPRPYHNAPTYFRPSDTNTHTMTTRAHTNSLQPKTFTTTRHPISNDPHPLLDKEPTTFGQANKHLCWQQAMQAEYKALMSNNTWSLVPRPCDTNLVGCKWVYRIKRNADGSIERYKARLVAKGFHQEEGVDYFDTFSPVVKPTTVRVVLSLALSKGWPIRQLDINNAFLNGDLAETVYMEQPKGFTDQTRPSHVCRLNKAIYGLKQAPRAWFNKLKSFLLSNGFRACYSDTSLFVHKSSTTTIYLLVYVDDLILTGSDSGYIRRFISLLHQAFSLKDLGSLRYFLGIEVLPHASGLIMSQSKYIRDVLARCHMADAKPISSPADPSSRLHKNGEPVADARLYRQVVGALQYATITRPEIAYAVNHVCQFMHSPTVTHWQAAKRILRYLKGTIDHGLLLQRDSSTQLRAYSDAGWISDKDDCRSQYGFAIYLGPNLISWTSRKQRVVARSSTEAEFRALAYTTAELSWLQQLLHELGVKQTQPPILLCDNIGATFMTANPIISSRSKHIHLDYYFVRERVDSGLLKVQHVVSADQLADIFTKPLASPRFSFLRSKLQVRTRT